MYCRYHPTNDKITQTNGKPCIDQLRQCDKWSERTIILATLTLYASQCRILFLFSRCIRFVNCLSILHARTYFLSWIVLAGYTTGCDHCFMMEDVTGTPKRSQFMMPKSCKFERVSKENFYSSNISWTATCKYELEISSNADTNRRVGDVIHSKNGKPQPMQSQ
jgi:hypothetical protein